MKAQKNVRRLQWISQGFLGVATILFLNGTLYGNPTSEQNGEEISMGDLAQSRTFWQPCKKNNNNNACHGTPKHLPEVLCRTFDVSLDFLYWKAYEDGLEYGTKMVGTPLIGRPSSVNTKLLDLDFKWDPGFRLGIGSAFDYFDCWGLQLNWTHIRNYARGNASAQGIESQVGNMDTIISPWVNLLFELRAGASNASAHWHVNYNTLDLDFGKNLPISKTFTVNPHFGFRGAWVNQHYKVDYKSVFLLAEESPPFTRQVTFKGTNDFSGFGLRSGTELMCRLSKNWHIFSHLAGNILYGRFNVKMKNLNDQGLGEGDILPMPIDFKASENFWRVRLCFEEMIGFGWETFFRCEQYRLRFRAAYDLSQWIHQNELFYTFYFRGSDTITSVPIRNQGDLSFQGIQLGGQFDF